MEGRLIDRGDGDRHALQRLALPLRRDDDLFEKRGMYQNWIAPESPAGQMSGDLQLAHGLSKLCSALTGRRRSPGRMPP
jgi:hypothetical protein